MISPGFRVVLVLCAAFSLGFVLYNIRRSKFLIRDSLFWFFLALSLMLMAMFPQLANAAALELGVQVPVHFVYLLVIFLLGWHEFHVALRLSAQEAKLQRLVQALALAQNSEQGLKSTQDSEKKAQSGTGQP